MGEQIQTMLNYAGFSRTTDEIIKKVKERNVMPSRAAGPSGPTPGGTAASTNSISKAAAPGPGGPSTDAQSTNTNQSGGTASSAAETVTTNSQPEEEIWTAAQQKQLEGALVKYPNTMPLAERWTAIAGEVEGKTKKQCAARFKALRE